MWRTERREDGKQVTRQTDAEVAAGQLGNQDRMHPEQSRTVNVVPTHGAEAAKVNEEFVQAKAPSNANGNHKSPASDSAANVEPPPPTSQSVANKDAALMQAYMDREGGSAGVGSADHWEGAMGSETRKNMFRVI